MDFSREPIAGIDYSPYRPGSKEILLLEEAELRNIEDHRYERFIRVWHTEREAYASCLKELILVLRPSMDSSHKDIFMGGINQFLTMFHSMNLQNNHMIQIYIDNWASHGTTRIQYIQEPIRVISQEQFHGRTNPSFLHMCSSGS